MRLGLFGHALHLFLAQARRGRDGDLLVLARAPVFGGHIEDAVGIDIESDLDLRHAAWGRWNAAQMKLTQSAIVFGNGALTLQHMHLNRWLAISRGREDFGFPRRNGGIARNHRSGYATQGLDRERQRRHV